MAHFDIARARAKPSLESDTPFFHYGQFPGKRRRQGLLDRVLILVAEEPSTTNIIKPNMSQVISILLKEGMKNAKRPPVIKSSSTARSE
jgi:hypothetical protein